MIPFSCPFPIQDYPRVQMAHGGGGRLMHELIGRMFLETFSGKDAPPPHDAAVVPVPGGRVAFTTDSYVVRPLFFPGGDVGSLAVHGTVNDLAMAGARPLALSAAFVIEEGLPMETLWKVTASMKAAAEAAGVPIVTGDTKVVDKGKGDGLFLNTAGIGWIDHSLAIGPASVRPGDILIVSGDLGRHGMAVMAVREGLEFECAIESDSAPVCAPVLDMIAGGVNVRCLRDTTRGGMTAALNEIAEGSGTQIRVRERAVPVRDDVRAACEVLGLDPFQVACEGRFIAFVDPSDEEKSLRILGRHAVTAGAVAIGRVAGRQAGGQVVLESAIGAARLLDLPAGEQLPRIC